jgi:hypothetical protein
MRIACSCTFLSSSSCRRVIAWMSMSAACAPAINGKPASATPAIGWILKASFLILT